jgi:pimeloyl-ACP methyl ester carboxylesterase
MPEDIDAFLRAMITPRRRQPPRLAGCLDGIDKRLVPTQFGRVAAWRIGEGPATLLVHGWEDDNSLWNEQILALRQRDHAAIAFDLPAHGFSEGDWGMAWEAADAARAVAEALGPVDGIIGHSMGAGSAAAAVMQGLQVKCCVLVAGAYPERGPNRWRRNAERQGLPLETADAAKRIYEECVGPQRASQFNLREQLADLNCAVLLVHSSADAHMPVGGAEAAATLHPQVKLLRVDGLSHRETARDHEACAEIADFVLCATNSEV